MAIWYEIIPKGFFRTLRPVVKWQIPKLITLSIFLKLEGTSEIFSRYLRTYSVRVDQSADMTYYARRFTKHETSGSYIRDILRYRGIGILANVHPWSSARANGRA